MPSRWSAKTPNSMSEKNNPEFEVEIYSFEAPQYE